MSGDYRIEVTPDQKAWLDHVNADLTATVAATDAKNTSVNTHTDSNKSLKQVNSETKTISVLQNTYFFSKTEARQVSAFANAVCDMNPNLKMDVAPGFLTKIKSLCAKILKFFGNENKAVQLQKEGIEVFNDLKNTLLDPKNRDFALKFIENQTHDACDTVADFDRKQNVQNVLRGGAKILGLKEADATPEKLEAFINVDHFKKLEKPSEKNMFLRKIFNECTDASLSPEDSKNKLNALLEEINRSYPKGSIIDSPEEQGSFFLAKSIFQRAVNNPDAKNLSALSRELNEGILMERLQEKMPDSEFKIYNNPKELLTWFKDNGQCGTLIDLQLLKDFPEVKTFLEQIVLPMSKDEVEAGLREQLAQPSKKMSEKNPPNS